VTATLVFTTDRVALRDPAGGPTREYTIGRPAPDGTVTLTPVPVQPTRAQIAAFKKAWEDADRLGLSGERTRAGLIAALNAPAPRDGF